MTKIFTILLLIISSISYAQTDVSGNVSGTWNLEGAPYQVIGDITVPSGQSLIIEAGVEVNFQGYYKFSITGNLQAIGTETDSIFFTTNNQSTGWGGIKINVANSSDIPSFSYCRFEFGKSANTEYPDIHGGAIALIGSDAVISHCVFADNDATGDDNGMGGAIYGNGTGNSSGSSQTSISNCKFIRNHCYGEGGAIKFTGDGNTEITDCKFIENDCLYGGGAISCYSVVDTKMINCLFSNNYTMYSNGGAIHMLGIGNSIIIKNCTIYGNSAVTGDGGGVYIVNGSANIVNTIVYDNSAMYEGDGVYVGFGGSAEINYSNLLMPDDATGTNNMNTDPLFIDATNGNFYLQEISPCIDAGNDIGLPFYGDAPDIGCFESNYGSGIYNTEYESYLIYPNPANSFIKIKNSQVFNSIIISDISGKIILREVFKSRNQSTINILNLEDGIYFLRLYSEKGILGFSKFAVKKN